MPLIYNKTNIREKRVKNFIDRLHRTFTNLILLEVRMSNVVDEDAAKTYIANLSTIDGETHPVLPLGSELVFNWNSMNLNYTSRSKFIKETCSGRTCTPELLNVLELDKTTDNDDYLVLSNDVRLKDGEVIFKNLEMYDYNYQSYEILNEIYRALEIYFASVESFYANFYKDSLGSFRNDFDDYISTGTDERIILVYDTVDMDNELFNTIFPIADTIPNAENRELVKTKYRQLRDDIKFFAMDIATEIDKEIDELLYCVNGSKKYSVRQNIETKDLEIIVDDNGYHRRLHAEEEVFFPFHNKPILDRIMSGLQEQF